MAWTTDDLAALETAIKSGVRKVKQGDKEIEYNSLSDMLRVRELMRKELGLTSAADTRIFTKFSKGL